MALVLLSLSVVTVSVNSLVITVIWKDPFKELRGSANYLILNLSICDLLVGIPGELLFGLWHWFPKSHGVVVVARAAMFLAFYASACTILWLAFERLIVISSPFNSVAHFTCYRLTFVIMSIWLSAGLLVFLSMECVEDNYCDGCGLYIADFIGIVIIVSFVACYTRIYLLVRESLYLGLTTSEERQAEGQYLTETARRIEKLKRKERRTAVTVLILVGIFAACWIPVFILENINKTYRSCGKKLDKSDALIFVHALLNAIAYSLCTVKFRRALCKICHRE